MSYLDDVSAAALAATPVGRVAYALLRDDFDRRLVCSAQWDDYSVGTQRAYLARADLLVELYERSPVDQRVLRLAARLLLHAYEHNRASSPEWDSLADDSQEQYLFRAQQIGRLIDGGEVQNLRVDQTGPEAGAR